jgi:hypothetical protein
MFLNVLKKTVAAATFGYLGISVAATTATHFADPPQIRVGEYSKKTSFTNGNRLPIKVQLNTNQRVDLSTQKPDVTIISYLDESDMKTLVEKYNNLRWQPNSKGTEMVSTTTMKNNVTRFDKTYTVDEKSVSFHDYVLTIPANKYIAMEDDFYFDDNISITIKWRYPFSWHSNVLKIQPNKLDAYDLEPSYK